MVAGAEKSQERHRAGNKARWAENHARTAFKIVDHPLKGFLRGTANHTVKEAAAPVAQIVERGKQHGRAALDRWIDEIVTIRGISAGQNKTRPFPVALEIGFLCRGHRKRLAKARKGERLM
jgi:hypothetical protein